MCSNRGMDWDKAKELYENGLSASAISNQLGCHRTSVHRRAKNDNWVRLSKTEVVLQSVAGGSAVTTGRREAATRGRKVLGEDVKERLQSDVEASLSALESINPADLGLNQLGSREKVAGDLTKRASQLFDMIEKEQPTMNIAVLAQLPD